MLHEGSRLREGVAAEETAADSGLRYTHGEEEMRSLSLERKRRERLATDEDLPIPFSQRSLAIAVEAGLAYAAGSCSTAAADCIDSW